MWTCEIVEKGESLTSSKCNPPEVVTTPHSLSTFKACTTASRPSLLSSHCSIIVATATDNCRQAPRATNSFRSCSSVASGNCKPCLAKAYVALWFSSSRFLIAEAENRAADNVGLLAAITVCLSVCSCISWRRSLRFSANWLNTSWWVLVQFFVRSYVILLNLFRGASISNAFICLWIYFILDCPLV